jgi:hypothetical protein
LEPLIQRPKIALQKNIFAPRVNEKNECPTFAKNAEKEWKNEALRFEISVVVTERKQFYLDGGVPLIPFGVEK